MPVYILSYKVEQHLPVALTEELENWSRIYFPSGWIDERERKAVPTCGGNVMKVVFECPREYMDLELMVLVGVSLKPICRS